MKLHNAECHKAGHGHTVSIRIEIRNTRVLLRHFPWIITDNDTRNKDRKNIPFYAQKNKSFPLRIRNITTEFREGIIVVSI
jgi:hypothetical protein